MAASPIGGNGVSGGEDGEKMDDIFHAGILYAEVVDTQYKGDWTGCVGPETRGEDGG